MTWPFGAMSWAPLRDPARRRKRGAKAWAGVTARLIMALAGQLSTLPQDDAGAQVGLAPRRCPLQIASSSAASAPAQAWRQHSGCAGLASWQGPP